MNPSKIDRETYKTQLKNFNLGHRMALDMKLIKRIEVKHLPGQGMEKLVQDPVKKGKYVWIPF